MGCPVASLLRGALVVGLLILRMSGGLADAAEPTGFDDPMTSTIMRADARLADVCFVDEQFGWAVGDRGTIWHCEDGGRTWQLQRSEVGCTLRSVHFLNRETGWVVGGEGIPHSDRSRGIVLLTRDGGTTWTHDRGSLLPALKQIRFFDAKQGWAVGEASAMFDSGVLLTNDGGRNWRSTVGVIGGEGWLGGDFLGPHAGALVGRSGRVAVVRTGGIVPSRSGPFGLRACTRVDLAEQGPGWLVGQGGLILTTPDGGLSWQTPPTELPEAVSTEFDFAALAVVDGEVWIAGSPGTLVFHSADGGRSWAGFRTGQTLPIRALTFVDPLHGWAVGELGTILGTVDGGRTWQCQRSGGKRVAVLALFAEPSVVPWEMLAEVSAHEGYLGAVETIVRRDVAPPAEGFKHLLDRVHEAAVTCGASSGRMAWQFPLKGAGIEVTDDQIADHWDRAHDGKGMMALREHLVRTIRQWRPDVIVTHGPVANGNDPLANVIHRSVVQAVTDAADPMAHAEQVTLAVLAPHRTRRLFAALPSPGTGEIQIGAATLAVRLGQTLSELTARGRSLLAERPDPPPEAWGFVAMVDEVSRSDGTGTVTGGGRRDLFRGIVLAPGGEARREWFEGSTETLDAMQRMAQRRRNLEAIMRRGDDNPARSMGLLGQVAEMTRDLDPPRAAAVLHQLGNEYFRNGQWDLCASARECLASEYPAEPLAESAAAWLVQYHASSEADWRMRGGQRVSSSGGPSRVINVNIQERPEEKAAAWGARLRENWPALFAEPTVRFPLASADRRRGLPRQAERFYLTHARGGQDAWATCAASERWLLKPEGQPPKPIVRCVRVTEKPHLDAKLDDVAWRMAAPARLVSPLDDDATWPAEVLLAHDEEFLYFAVRARSVPGTVHAKPDKKPRPRDADLSAHDRVELHLDLDRDYATAYRLTVDGRGFTHDACWGDAGWNPTWFVAAGVDQGVWIIEAAVPLEQLTGNFPRTGTAWAVGLQRIVPGVGFQSWSTPATLDGAPEGFGLLTFE